MPIKEWNIQLDRKLVHVRLEHNPWNNTRKVYVDGTMQIDAKSKGFTDVGSLHELNVYGEKLFVRIYTQPNIFKNQGYGYDVIKEVDAQKSEFSVNDEFQKIKELENEYGNKFRGLGIAFLVIVISIIVGINLQDLRLYKVVMSILLFITIGSLVYVSLFAKVSKQPKKVILYSAGVTFLTMVTYILIDRFVNLEHTYALWIIAAIYSFLVRKIIE